MSGKTNCKVLYNLLSLILGGWVVSIYPNINYLLLYIPQLESGVNFDIEVSITLQ